MPQMSTIISGVVSLGVLAGVVSGIFYLVLTGIRWAGRIRAALLEEEVQASRSRQEGSTWDQQCVACARGLGVSPVVHCQLCGSRTCKGAPCSRPIADPQQIGWICLLCHAKRELKVDSDDKKTTHKKIDDENLQVRQFIENIVQNLVGGSLDGVSLGRLSSQNEYTDMFVKFHAPLCHAVTRMEFALTLYLASKSASDDDSPSSIHDELSQLIAQIIKEAQKLTDLRLHENKSTSRVSSLKEIEGKSYEDILATAILNKVIEKHQGYSNLENYNSEIYDEDIVEWNDLPEKEPLSLTIEEKIEEVTTTYVSSDEENELDSHKNSNQKVPFPEYGIDLVDRNETSSETDSDVESHATELTSSNATWEENWLFRKRKSKKKKNSSVPPVPMLVPNPSHEFRALIGGVDADEMSELSECSDSALEEALSEIPEDASKTEEILNLLNNDDESLTGTNSQPHDDFSNTSGSTDIADDALKTTSSKEFTNSEDTLTFPDSLNTDTSQSSSLIQQDRELIIDYDTIPTKVKPPVPRPRTKEVEETRNVTDEEESDPPIKCPIAEREKAKWNNAIELKDNPYSPENIAKRLDKNNMILQLSRAASVDILNFSQDETPGYVPPAYSRDFYVKASKSPTGENSPLLQNMLHKKPDSPDSVFSETSTETKQKQPDEFDVNSLPKVSELRSTFLKSNSEKELTRREKEVTCASPMPITKIIEELKGSNKMHNSPTNKQEEIYKEIAQVRENAQINAQEVEENDIVLPSAVYKHINKQPVKPVHSLTARSIPKDFREGLKKSGTNIKPTVALSTPNLSMQEEDNLHWFDIRDKKRFWEDLIASKTKSGE